MGRGGGGMLRRVSTPPSAIQNGDGDPLLSKIFQGFPPGGKVARKGCRPIFSIVTPPLLQSMWGERSLEGVPARG